jgi:hypothetical protein
LEPDNGQFVNTLGIAQYRLGEYKKALETLTRSDQINVARDNVAHPADLAFLAMTQHQLGRPDQAKATLVRLREIMKQPRWAQAKKSQGFLREAEALIQKSAQPRP